MGLRAKPRIYYVDGRWFWERGEQILDATIVESHSQVGSSSRSWLTRYGKKRRTSVEIIPMPPGRCPHCGRKTGP